MSGHAGHGAARPGPAGRGGAVPGGPQPGSRRGAPTPWGPEPSAGLGVGPLSSLGFGLTKPDLLCTCPGHGSRPPAPLAFCRTSPAALRSSPNRSVFIVSLPKANYNNYTLILGFALTLYRLGLGRSSGTPYAELVSNHSDKYKHQSHFCCGLGRKQRQLLGP